MKSIKERYKQEVRKNLVVDGNRKKAILRDLDEIFEQGKELNESETDVITRLGNGREYANAIQSELGIDVAAKRRTQTVIAIITLLAVFAIALMLCLVIRGNMSPSDSIGFADGSTEIVLVGTEFNFYKVFFAISACYIVFAVALAVRLIKFKGGRKG